MKDIVINPDLFDNNNLMTFNGVKVRIFPSTQRGNSVTAEYLEGPSQGKWGTIDLKHIERIQA